MFIFVLFYSSKGLLIWRIYTPAETKVSMSQTACDSLQMTELHVTVINVSSQNTYPVQCSQAKHHKKTTPSCLPELLLVSSCVLFIWLFANLSKLKNAEYCSTIKYSISQQI